MENREILYFTREKLIENKKLVVSAYEMKDGKRVKFLAQYAGYYRSRSETVVLYPTYNQFAYEQNKARKHIINERLIRYI